MKKKRTRWIIVAVLLGVFGLSAFLFISHLLRQDEAPLDYSALEVHRGVNDPATNGYSALRELAQARDLDLSDAFHELREAPREDWDAEALQEFLDQHSWVFPKVNAAFEKPTFHFDQPNTLETLIPEVGFFRRYCILATFKARVAMAEGDYEAALTHLTSLASKVERFNQAGGGLIHLLTAIASCQIIHAELSHFLAEAELAPEAFAAAANTWEFYPNFTNSFQTSMRHEFQLARYSIQLVKEGPEEILENWESFGDGSVDRGSSLKKTFYRWAIGFAYKPTETKNVVFRFCMEALEEAGKPASERAFPVSGELTEDYFDPTEKRFLTRNVVGRILLAILLPAFETVQAHLDQAEASGAATQLLFALRAYYGETGELPDSLAALVPDYLDAIPKDPFDGQPMRYSKQRRIVYSVGGDFTDSGGSQRKFRHELNLDDEYDSAERDPSEPTFPIRFVDSP